LFIFWVALVFRLNIMMAKTVIARTVTTMALIATGKINEATLDGDGVVGRLICVALVKASTR
jgi:hypothetical protein